jgi:transcription elongation factor Elf1
MADTTPNLKSFDLTCPECGEDFEIECDPAVSLTDDGDLIECPNCFNEWEWDYDQEAGTLELFDDEADMEDTEDLPIDADQENGEDEE